MATIVIDPGHGGYDTGTVNGMRLEKTDTLRLGLAVARRLLEQGQKVLMTRDGDAFVSLEERSAISNGAAADLFVSLHRNSSANPASGGVEIFVRPGTSSREAQYAREVLGRLADVGIRQDRGVRQANYAALRGTQAPAMLIELGFISNEEDNALYDRHLDAYAAAITDGMLHALGGGSAPPPPEGGNHVVRKIAGTLNTRYGTGLTVNGLYDLPMKQALVKGLQMELNALFDAGLTADGLFGATTKAAVPALHDGARGRLVWLIQAALYAKGCPVELDGVCGERTRQAVRVFQGVRGLTADGVAGPHTVEKLFK